MKLELKDFQDAAVDQLIKKLTPAKREVAEAAGCSKSHLHSLEGDKCEPGILMCAKLSVALGLSVQSMAAAAICGALQKALQPQKGSD